MAKRQPEKSRAKPKPRKSPPRKRREPKPKAKPQAKPAPAIQVSAFKKAEPSGHRAFPIVGLGASAGGLEALRTFFGAVASDTGAAFVVVTHQHPGHATMLPELIGQQASMNVELIVDRMVVKPNHIYVMPAGGPLNLEKGVLRIAKGGPLRRLPIDHFFRSLAKDRGEDSVGIVLSGTGSDGTLGIAEIKAAGGFVMAQEPSSARYSSMPTSAAASHLVDAVQRPEEMPEQLVRYIEARRREKSPQEEADAAIQRVLHLLRSRTGHDFNAYKKSTVIRRIERRMHVRNVADAREYVHYLEQHSPELDTLFRELLISVTNFFRDEAAFDALREELRRTLRVRDEVKPFRAWVPACATGEEVYTIAIVIQEVLAELGKNTPVQIFATDLDQQAIDYARAGFYPAGISADVTDTQLARFFVKEDGGYRINKAVRETIVFAAQNLIKDPPFTKLDLLSCRNLLIYLEPDLQRRVIALFSYALRPGGLLLLGSSESISGFDDAFKSLYKKGKLFVRRESRVEPPQALSQVPSQTGSMGPDPIHLGEIRHPATVSLLAERVLLASFAPPSVLINDRGDILFFHGKTAPFLEPPAGEAKFNILNMAREGLRLNLLAAIRQAQTSKEPVVRSDLKVKSNGGFSNVTLTVRSLPNSDSMLGLLLVSFESEPAGSTKKPGRTRENSHEAGQTVELEAELQRTRESLQGTIEELETSNEELKSTNEELQSTNEELQSANEELETSREEMQSLNEELQTVNSELEERNRGMAQANQDMQNLLNSTDIPTVFLDDTLAIKRFTTQAVKVFSLIDSDLGRPISDLSANLRYDGIMEDAREVLRSLLPKEREIQTKDGAWRIMRIMPHRTRENVIEGVVMTFFDIDRLKLKEQSARTALSFAESILEAFPYGAVALDKELRIVRANRAFWEAFRTLAKGAVGEPIQHVADGVLDTPELIVPVRHMFENGEPERSFKFVRERHRLGEIHLSLRARRLLVEGQALVLLTIDDAKF